MIIDLSNGLTASQQLSNVGRVYSAHTSLQTLQNLGLSLRQIEVILVQIRGETNNEIGRRPGISTFTVKQQIEMAYTRMRVHNFRELVKKLTQHTSRGKALEWPGNGEKWSRVDTN